MNSHVSPHRWLLLFGVWFLYGTFALVVTSIAPLVGVIESDLSLTHAAMGSIMGAWQLVYIFSAIPCGMLLDRLGPRVALTLGGLIIASSAMVRGIATSYVELLLAVMLFGLGGPIISAGAPKVIAGCFTGSSRGLAMGIYMTGPSLGGIVSLTLTHSFLLPFLGSWRHVMFLWSGTAAIAAITWLTISSLRSPEPPSQGESKRPQLEVMGKLIRQPAVILLLAMSVGVFMFNHGLNNWLPELLHTSGLTIVEAGYWAAIPTVIGLIGSLLIPRLATPGRRFYILIGLCLSAAGASLLLQFEAEPLMFSGLILQGIARSSLMTVLVLTLVELPGIGERYAGVASGMFFSAAEVGGMLGPLSIGFLYDLTHGFSASLYLLTSVTLLLAVAGFRLKHLAARSSDAV